MIERCLFLKPVHGWFANYFLALVTYNRQNLLLTFVVRIPLLIQHFSAKHVVSEINLRVALVTKFLLVSKKV